MLLGCFNDALRPHLHAVVTRMTNISNQHSLSRASAHITPGVDLRGGSLFEVVLSAHMCRHITASAEGQLREGE